MAKNQHLKIFLTVLIWFVFSGILSIQPVIETANAADTSELKATDLDRINPGTEAPDFNLESIDKAMVKLSSYQNRKNVVLIFYRGYW
jgi:hypothetical protein